MAEVAIIADDLTGAADCGIAFAAAGLPTFVALGDAPAPASAQVLAVDADTRRLATEEAAARTGVAAERALRDGARVLYKKLDSTLRGHVGAEIAATLQAASAAGRGRPLLILAPAFPATGRVTRDGRVFVNGVPLEETEVWRDAGMQGSADADLVAMLRLAGVHASAVRLADVRAEPELLARELAQLATGDVGALVCDAEEERDLRAIAQAGARVERPVVWAGSGGLARHLPAALALRPYPAARAAGDGTRGPVLILAGSRSSVAREQADRAASEAGVARVELDPHALLAGAAAPGEALARALDAGDVVAVVGTARVGSERALELAAAVGRLAAAHAARLGGLVATGGDIARAAFAALGATGLHLLGEVEPGVPMGITDGGRPLPVVTKAGAFGSPAALSRCRAALRELARRGGARQA